MINVGSLARASSARNMTSAKHGQPNVKELYSVINSILNLLPVLHGYGKTLAEILKLTRYEQDC